MTQHIGIVACSAEGAALCYRAICAQGSRLLGPHAHPEVSIHSLSLSEYVDCLERGDMQGLATLMLKSAKKLAKLGVDFLICPDNTIHQVFDQVEAHLPRPLLHIAEVVAKAAVKRGYQRIGLVGTRWLVDSDVYTEKLAERKLACVRPGAADRDEINRIIMDELVNGDFKPRSVAYFQQVFARMKADGCDAVILGCTEIPLIMNDSNAGLATLDSTRLLAEAAVLRAVHTD